jgi:hypothetical protein
MELVLVYSRVAEKGASFSAFSPVINRNRSHLESSVLKTIGE